jgi:hypothetical protein
MAHVITGTDAYPMPATTVPDGGDPATATAGGPAPIDVPLQAHEDKLATLAGRIGGETSGLNEWAYPSALGRSTRVPAVGGTPLTVYVDFGTGLTTPVPYGSGWRSHYLIAAGAGPGGRDIVSATGRVYCDKTLHTYERQLDRLIMPGGTMVSIEFRVVKGTAQATVSSRMVVTLYKVDLLGTITTIASGTSNALAGAETIFLLIAGGEVYDQAGHMYYADVTSSVGAGPGTEDYFYGCNINWDDPGPRN